METFDVAVVVLARVHGTDYDDATRRLTATLEVEIGKEGGPLKRAVGLQPPGTDIFIRPAGYAAAPHLADMAGAAGMFSRLDVQKRDMS